MQIVDMSKPSFFGFDKGSKKFWISGNISGSQKMYMNIDNILTEYWFQTDIDNGKFETMSYGQFVLSTWNTDAIHFDKTNAKMTYSESRTFSDIFKGDI